MSDITLFFFISHIMTTIVALFLGIFVLLNVRNKMTILFFYMSVFIALWSLFYAIWAITDSHDNALIYAKILNFFSIFIPVLYFHWICVFLNRKNKCKLFLVFAYIFTGFVALFSFSNLFIDDVQHVMVFEYFPQSGIIHSIFLVYWIGVIFYSIFLLVIAYKKANGDYKKQILFVLLGAIIGFGGGAFNWPLMFGVEIFLPVTSAMVLLVPLVWGYTIMRHNLMDVKLALIQFFIIILNSFAIGFIFLSNSIGEYIAKSVFMIITVSVSYLLKKSYDKEVEQKEKLLKLTKELERANTELMRLDKAKSEFVSIASHQLRTPLTAIKGYISLILEGAYGKHTPRASEALNKIFLANERLIQLVEDLLNITHIEAGRLEYHIGNVHVEEILEELYEMFILRAKDKDLEFILDLSDKKLPVVQADKSKLREVVSNLIDNAIKYTKKGFVHVSVEYDKKTMRIIVEDSGVGISPESMKTLFAKFSRGTDSSKIYTEGTGLGLFVGKNLIESQGGHVYAESEGVGKGSRFIIEMPIKNKKK